MFKTKWIVLLPLGILLAAESLADDSDTAAVDGEQIPRQMSTAIAADAERQFSYLWQMRYPVALTTFPEDWPATIDDFDFQDTSMYGRVSRLRNLSLLTLAEFGQRRLFLGVNEDGVVGVHLGAFSEKNDQRYLEVVRLPYLKELDTDGDVDQSEAESRNPVAQQITHAW